MIYNVTKYTTSLHFHSYKMADSKIYLDVPYAQKDSAKALGARWDAITKKWYVPTGKDITLFEKWQTGIIDLESPSKTATKPGSKISSSKNSSSVNSAVGVITYPTDKSFAAYNGDEPPWD
jgi:hypothetical protein